MSIFSYKTVRKNKYKLISKLIFCRYNNCKGEIIMKDNKLIKEIMKIFWIFVIGCIIGYITEMIVVFVQKGFFESRQGLLYGPFIPVYGIGAVIYYLFFSKVKCKNKVYAFFYTMILGGVVEFLCSYIQQKLFNTVSWNYSNLPFNIDGRTSLLHCTYWGLAGVLYITYISPFIEKIDKLICQKKIKIVTYFVMLFMVFNISISCIAGIRQKERMNNIPPSNEFEKFIDTHYNDDYMNRIYTNKIDIIA